MLAHINLRGKVSVWDIHEDDLRVIQQLLKDRKIKIVGDDYVSINAPLYFGGNVYVDAVAFHLAASNPANEQFVAVYRKNWIVPDLPEYPGNVEDDLTVAL